MNATELRAAADALVEIKAADERGEDARETCQRVFGHIDDDAAVDFIAKAAVEMARYILATVHADDDEPVTEGWLADTGFTAEPDEFSDSGFSYRRNGLHICQLADYWHWQVGGTENFWESLAHPTHGQVRRLLSALGIEVKQ